MARTLFFSLPSSSVKESEFLTQEFEFVEFLPEMGTISSHVAGAKPASIQHYALLEFERPIVCPSQSTVIGSRLDADTFSNKCRIAFHGCLIEQFTPKDYASTMLPRVRIFKLKRREGLIDRVGVECFVGD